MVYTFRAVELARTGTFDASTGKVTLTAIDFANMVSAFQDLKGKYGFPLKLGHNDGQPLLKNDGLPAAGWLANVRVDGDRLIADFEDVPDGIAKLINQRAIRNRSIEYSRNVIVAGKRYPVVLTACALLGETLPAVDSLSDIAALYTAASLEPLDIENAQPVMALASSTSDLETELDKEELEALITEVLGALEKTESKVKGKQGAPVLRALIASTIRQFKQVASGSYRKDLAMFEKVREMLKLKDDATEAEVEAAIAALSKGDGKGDNGDNKPDDKGDDDSSEAATLRAELAATNKKIIDIEQRNALAAASTAVDAAIAAGKFLPAVRDSLVKMASADLDTFVAMAKATPDKSAIKLGAAGTSGDGDSTIVNGFDASKFEPSESELKVAKLTGLSREDIIRQKATDAGIEVPESFGKQEDDGAIDKLASAIAAKLAK